MGSGHGFLFTCKSRESLLVGQLLSQKRPGSWRHSSSFRKEGRENKKKEADRSAPSSLPPSAQRGAPGEGPSGHRLAFWKSRALLLPDLAHLPSTCCSCRRSARELSSREKKALVFSKEAVQSRKAADWPEVWASRSHPPEWLPACVTVTLTAATPVLPALHPSIHGSEATFALHGPLTPCSVL